MSLLSDVGTRVEWLRQHPMRVLLFLLSGPVFLVSTRRLMSVTFAAINQGNYSIGSDSMPSSFDLHALTSFVSPLVALYWPQRIALSFFVISLVALAFAFGTPLKSILGSKGLAWTALKGFGQFVATQWADRPGIVVMTVLLLIVLTFCILWYKTGKKDPWEFWITLFGVPLGSRSLDEVLARLKKDRVSTMDAKQIKTLMDKLQLIENTMITALANEQANPDHKPE